MPGPHKCTQTRPITAHGGPLQAFWRCLFPGLPRFSREFKELCTHCQPLVPARPTELHILAGFRFCQPNISVWGSPHRLLGSRSCFSTYPCYILARFRFSFFFFLLLLLLMLLLLLLLSLLVLVLLLVFVLFLLLWLFLFFLLLLFLFRCPGS